MYTEKANSPSVNKKRRFPNFGMESCKTVLFDTEKYNF